MRLPYLSHQCSKTSPVPSNNPRSLFSPRKEAAVYTSHLPDIYRRVPEVRCRGPDAGKKSLHCHPGDVPVRSLFLPILPLPAQIFRAVLPASSSDILYSTAIFGISTETLLHGISFFSHSVFTNSSSAFASSPRIP